MVFLLVRNFKSFDIKLLLTYRCNSSGNVIHYAIT